MKPKNKFLTSIITFIFICTTTSTAFAQEETDYEQVSQGDCVKSDGFFFTQPGMAKLAANVESKTKLAVVDKQKEVDLCNIDLKKCQSGKQIELKIQKEMYEEQLLVKQKVIDSQKSQMFWSNITSSVSSLALGAIIGVSVFYFVSK